MVQVGNLKQRVPEESICHMVNVRTTSRHVREKSMKVHAVVAVLWPTGCIQEESMKVVAVLAPTGRTRRAPKESMKAAGAAVP